MKWEDNFWPRSLREPVVLSPRKALQIAVAYSMLDEMTIATFKQQGQSRDG